MTNTFKFYDTSSLLISDDSLFDTPFAISSITLQELEKIKTSTHKDEEIKYQARQLIRKLYENDGKYEIVDFCPAKMAQRLSSILGYWEDTGDMCILASALHYDSLHPDDVTFVTNDFSLFITANYIFGKDSVQMIGYEEEEDYVGYQKQVMSDEELGKFYTNLNDNIYNLEIGQYLLIFNSENELVDTVVWTGKEHRHLKFGCFSSRTFGNIKPIAGDAYQACAVDSLLNNQVTMIKGAPGSGKTTLALGYLFSLLERGKISKIVVFCNTVATKNSAKLGL